MKLVLCFLVFIACTQAYCIYNRSKVYGLKVRQLEMHVAVNKEKRLKQYIGAGYRTCCHFSVGDCNSTGDPRTVVEFALQRRNASRGVGELFTVTAPAGGWIGIEDDSEPFVYYADGTPFPYTYRINEEF